MESIKGFKVFNPDWTCRGFQYKVGESYEIDKEPKVCSIGFHFCLKASDCFNFYDFTCENKVAEVEAYGDIDQQEDESKFCTNKIRIVREITWDEVLRIVNEGKNCTGLCNTGNRNTGNRNTGNRNTGDRNTGNRNTGDYNTGDCNTGNRNTGNYNTGDWNIISSSAGCFNTKTQKMIMFNKPCDWTLEDWRNSKAGWLLNQIQRNVVEWVFSCDMTDEEKAAHPTYETTGGYLKILDNSECAQLWWNDLDEEEREVIYSLPNFDADIFEKCTGIKI